MPELIRIVINEAMRLERQQYLGVAPYQRSPERRGHGNGFKEHTARTRLGEITFAVPQVREGGFFPQALEKGLRSERALTLSLAEMRDLIRQLEHSQLPHTCPHGRPTMLHLSHATGPPGAAWFLIPLSFQDGTNPRPVG